MLPTWVRVKSFIGLLGLYYMAVERTGFKKWVERYVAMDANRLSRELFFIKVRI